MDYFFFELSGQFDISQIHKIFFGDVGIEVLFVVVKRIKRVIVELTFVLVVIHLNKL